MSNHVFKTTGREIKAATLLSCKPAQWTANEIGGHEHLDALPDNWFILQWMTRCGLGEACGQYEFTLAKCWNGDVLAFAMSTSLDELNRLVGCGLRGVNLPAKVAS